MTDTMTDTTTSIYEGLFLFPQSAVADLQGALDHINMILDRAGAEVIALSKWDERRLAYDVQGNRRGLFFLAFFKADRSKIAGIERDCNLSELLLRALVTRADHVPSELIETAEGRAQLAEEITMRQKTGEKEAAPVQFERASDKAPAAEATTEAPAEAPAVEAPATEAPTEAPAVKAPATEAKAPAETEAPTETPPE